MIDLGIQSSAVQAAMTEDLADLRQRRSCLEHRCRRGMTESVRTDLRHLDPVTRRVDDLPDAMPCQPSERGVCAQKQGSVLAWRPTVTQVTCDSLPPAPHDFADSFSRQGRQEQAEELKQPRKVADRAGLSLARTQCRLQDRERGGGRGERVLPEAQSSAALGV